MLTKIGICINMPVLYPLKKSCPVDSAKYQRVNRDKKNLHFISSRKCKKLRRPSNNPDIQSISNYSRLWRTVEEQDWFSSCPENVTRFPRGKKRLFKSIKSPVTASSALPSAILHAVCFDELPIQPQWRGTRVEERERESGRERERTKNDEETRAHLGHERSLLGNKDETKPSRRGRARETVTKCEPRIPDARPSSHYLAAYRLKILFPPFVLATTSFHFPETTSGTVLRWQPLSKRRFVGIFLHYVVLFSVLTGPLPRI